MLTVSLDAFAPLSNRCFFYCIYFGTNNQQTLQEKETSVQTRWKPKQYRRWL